MKTYLALFCAVSMFLVNSVAWAGSTAAVNVYADVDAMLELTTWIKKVQDTQDPGTEGTLVTDGNMRFGALTDTFADGTKAGNLFSRTWFCVFLVANTSGRPYYIRQYSSSLLDGIKKIPDNCYMMVPDYRIEDEWEYPDGTKVPQGAIPTGAFKGDPGPAAGTHVVYTSGTQGKSRIARSYYTVTNGWKDATTQWPGFTGTGIPLDQPEGDYAASITFTVVLQSP